jgi:ABC-type sugar transport system substrate-binding protein
VKRIIALSLFLLIGAFLFAQVDQLEQSWGLPKPNKVPAGKQLTLAYLAPELTNTSTIRCWYQAQIEAKQRGWKLIADNNCTYEANKERTAFQRVLAQNPTAILMAYLDVPPIKDLVIEARKRGIGVFCMNTDLFPGVLVDIDSANSVIAAKIMQYAIQKMNGHSAATGFLDLWMPRGIRRDIIAAAMVEKGGWDFPKTEHHKLTPEGYTDEIFKVTTNWITKYGKDLGFVWVCWDLGAITAAKAMAEKGYTEKDMFTVGIDGGSATWAELRQGKVPFAASLADPFEYQIHTLCEAVKNVHIDGLMPGEKGNVIPITHYITADDKCVVIDRSNVPPVGTNIHAVFNFYGGDPNDKKQWYNWGSPYTVKADKDF